MEQVDDLDLADDLALLSHTRRKMRDKTQWHNALQALNLTFIDKEKKQDHPG
jgi:hypothetical protein